MSLARPDRLRSHVRDFTPSEIEWIARQFVSPVEIHLFENRGNINLDCYEVRDRDGAEYLLQRINTDVFKQPIQVMEAMAAWSRAQADALQQVPGSIWTPVTLALTYRGHTYLDLDGDNHSVWRMMHKIPGAVTYKSLADVGSRERQLRVARATGEGLATCANLTSAIKADDIEPSLPGYRDTHAYMAQFGAIIADCRTPGDTTDFLHSNEKVRRATENFYTVKLEPSEYRRRVEKSRDLIEMIKEYSFWAGGLQRGVEMGVFQTLAIHGDTKIENFLYNDHDQVLSLVDLDTIMPYTWLADWGDLVRSLVNVAGEKERDMDRVQVDEAVYFALTDGFASACASATPTELKLMPRAVETITFELGTRFLTDYLRGDDYFGVAEDPELNFTRGQVQLTLFERLQRHHGTRRDEPAL